MGRMRPAAGRVLFIFLIAALLLTQFALVVTAQVVAAGPPAGQDAPVNPDFEAWMLEQESQALRPAQKSAQSVTEALPTEDRPLGLVPRPIDLRHLDRLPVTAASRLQNNTTAGVPAAATGAPSAAMGATAGLPATFDWRTLEKVTPVRDQSSCGTCWAFGTMAAFESRTWIEAGSQNDFSEQNLVCCSDPAWSYLTGRRCNAGGWDFIAVDTLIKKGARLESCDPYNPSTISTAVCQGCSTSYKATGFRIVTYTAAGNEAAIKEAIYNNGPVEASFYYSSGNVYALPPSTTPRYIIHNPNSTRSRNHLICIVGWDDTFSYGGVTGAWIIKNSWGASSGQSGYYYMTYGSSNLGDVGYFISVKANDSAETLYYWDEAGLVGARGYNDSSAWMANIFTVGQGGTLTAVDFWTTSSNAQYIINVYSGSFGSLLATQSGVCAEEGYYSIPLTASVNLDSGRQFTVAVKMTTPGYSSPLPVERAWSSYCNPPIQTGVSFERHYDTDAWSDMGASSQRNACLRARVIEDVSGSAGDNFTIVALPDTQHYSLSYPAIFTAQTQWIKDNKASKNIVFVTQEGDIINNTDNTTQWSTANAAMSILDGQVPYGIAPGNHDGAPGGTANFNTYFPSTRYSGQSWYGGHYGTDNDNSYQIFSAGGRDYIILHIEYGADSSVLSWADGVLKANSSRRAILTGHYLLNTDGSFGAGGQAIYEALKGNPNLILMFCGHMYGEARRSDTYNGRTVTTLLADYQERTNGGDGWLRLLEFNPSADNISVRTYSPTLDQYETDENSQFEIQIGVSSQPVTAIFKQGSGLWYIDTNREGLWTDGQDEQLGPFGRVPGDIPLAIDWDGNGQQELCIFRPGEGTWYIDSNRSGGWNAGDTQLGPFGRVPGDIPLAIDWDGNGTQELCIFRPGAGTWYIDSDRSGGWNAGDTQLGPFGRVPGDIPLAIDWDGNGTQELCIFRPGEGTWYIDSNHSGGWNAGDTQLGPFGRVPGDIPLAIDWDGNGQQEPCIFRPGEGNWYIDSNRSGGWNAGDTRLGPFGGVAGDKPVILNGW